MDSMIDEHGNGRTKLSENERTSTSLIVGLKEDRAEAWERLVDLYSPLVYYWCQRSGLPRADLNDIFQDVFHALARNIKKYQTIESGSFRGWLRTMTRNKVNDHFRKVGRQAMPTGGTEAQRLLEQVPDSPLNKLSQDPSQQASASSSISDPGSAERINEPDRESQLQQVMLRKALANIRHHFQDKTWQAFWMVAVDGRAVGDVAADLGMQPGTVRVAKSRVLKRLRLEVGDSVD